MTLDELLKEKAVMFGNIPPCEIGDCLKPSTDFVQPRNGDTTYLCHEHFKAYTHVLAYPVARRAQSECVD